MAGLAKFIEKARSPAINGAGGGADQIMTPGNDLLHKTNLDAPSFSVEMTTGFTSRLGAAAVAVSIWLA